MNENQAQELYKEIFRDYRGQGWTCWKGHFVAKANSKKGVGSSLARALEKNGQWKGGRVKYGPYIRVKMANHPKATVTGYVAEHILMAELDRGSFLPDGAAVHHKNEDGSDNRIENLKVFNSNSEHVIFHRMMRAFKICGHYDWMRCRYCHTYDQVENLIVKQRKNGETFPYHEVCRAESDKAAWIKIKSARSAIAVAG